MLAGVILIKLDSASADEEPAPFGMASRALTARFITTCSSMPVSASIEAIPAIAGFQNHVFAQQSRQACWPGLQHGVKIEYFERHDLLAAEMSNWRVSVAARWEASEICFSALR